MQLYKFYMKNTIVIVTGIICFTLFVPATDYAQKSRNKPVLIAYDGGFRGIAPVDSLSPK